MKDSLDVCHHFGYLFVGSLSSGQNHFSALNRM